MSGPPGTPCSESAGASKTESLAVVDDRGSSGVGEVDAVDTEDLLDDVGVPVGEVGAVKC